MRVKIYIKTRKLKQLTSPTHQQDRCVVQLGVHSIYYPTRRIETPFSENIEVKTWISAKVYPWPWIYLYKKRVITMNYQNAELGGQNETITKEVVI